LYFSWVEGAFSAAHPVELSLFFRMRKFRVDGGKAFSQSPQLLVNCYMAAKHIAKCDKYAFGNNKFYDRSRRRKYFTQPRSLKLDRNLGGGAVAKGAGSAEKSAGE